VLDEPIIADSAYRHDVAEADIRHAYRNPIRIWDLGDGFTMTVGPSQSASLLEIGYVHGHRHRPCHARAREVPEVMTMPRTVDDILRHADQLAERFETYEPNPADELDAEAVAQLRAAVQERSMAERHVLEAIKTARAKGLSWAAVGSFVGTTGEAARQRYAALV